MLLPSEASWSMPDIICRGAEGSRAKSQSGSRHGVITAMLRSRLSCNFAKDSMKGSEGLETHLERHFFDAQVLIQQQHLGSLDPRAIEVFNKHVIPVIVLNGLR
jgi:hypothetical protein